MPASSQDRLFKPFSQIASTTGAKHQGTARGPAKQSGWPHLPGGIMHDETWWSHCEGLKSCPPACLATTGARARDDCDARSADGRMDLGSLRRRWVASIKTFHLTKTVISTGDDSHPHTTRCAGRGSCFRIALPFPVASLPGPQAPPKQTLTLPVLVTAANEGAAVRRPDPSFSACNEFASFRALLALPPSLPPPIPRRCSAAWLDSVFAALRARYSASAHRIARGTTQHSHGKRPSLVLQAALEQMLGCFGVSCARVAPPDAALLQHPAPASLSSGTATSFTDRKRTSWSDAMGFFDSAALSAEVSLTSAVVDQRFGPPSAPPGSPAASALALPPAPLAQADAFEAALAAALGGLLRPCVLVIECSIMLMLMEQGFRMPHAVVRPVVIGRYADLKRLMAAAPLYPPALAAMKPVKAASLWRRVQAAAGIASWPLSPEEFAGPAASAAGTPQPAAAQHPLPGMSSASGGESALPRPPPSPSEREREVAPIAQDPSPVGPISVLLVECVPKRGQSPWCRR